MNVAKCPNALCTTVEPGGSRRTAAHLCEHGKPCKYMQTPSGTIIDWGRSCCRACNVRLEAAGLPRKPARATVAA